jgi:hypothetical protein
MRIAAALLAIVSFVFAAGDASPQQPSRGARMVCAPTASEKTTVEAIAANPAAWIGKCVSVQAIYASERLYADEDAIYGLNAKSIGGYVDGQGDVLGYWRGTFTGRVSDCAQAENDLMTGLLRSPGISLHYRTLGCLEAKGTFLVFMSQGELKPAGLTRRLPGAKGADLSVAGRDWEHLRAAILLGQRVLAALRSPGASSLDELVTGNAYQAEQIMFGPETAITKLKTAHPGQSEVFRHASSSTDHVSAEICYCLTKDCTKRWPITRRDADNQADRPYACLRIDGEREDGLWSYTVDASRDFNGLPEPR